MEKLQVDRHHHPFYQSWQSMKKRCSGNVRFYENITYDPKWESFDQFYKDMFKTWKPNLRMSLDRIDGTKGYSKENCRWATPKEQANNTKRNRKLTVNGITKNMCQWVEERHLKYTTVKQRLNYGWPVERALEMEAYS